MMRFLIALLFAGSALAATFTDMTVDGVILSETSTHNELYQSFAERYRFAGQITNTTQFASRAVGWEWTEVEDPASTYSLNTWLQMQYWVDSNASGGSWSMSTSAPSVVAVLADLLPITNIVQVYTAAGMATNGWRKATVYNPDIHDWEDPYDIMWTNTVGNGYGRIEEGDIIGPWIFDDLQRAVDVYRMRLFNNAPPTYAGNMQSTGEKTRRSVSQGFGNRTNSYAAAVALLESHWSGYSSSLVNDEFPLAAGTSIAFPDGDVEAIGIVQGPVSVGGIAIGPAVTNLQVHVYAYSEQYGTVGSILDYNAMGTGLIETNYARIVTDEYPAAATNRTLTTSGFGYSYEDCPEIPSPATGDGKTSSGYKVTAVIVLIEPRWPYTR